MLEEPKPFNHASKYARASKSALGFFCGDLLVMHRSSTHLLPSPLPLSGRAALVSHGAVKA